MAMPTSKANEKVGRNIKKIVHNWEQDGAIGNSHPKSKKKAIKQAVAISLKKAGKSKYQKKGAKH
ncbi:MAG TPA: hypothetical protein DIT28_14000 [Oxalobacteraceae bacterium]|jgi:hypothetical protein|nr:hypothetical protein [Oxalobacteraceae bacterium]HCN90269.1 hypothetical protein [Oxalobacteraceae bacterium]